MDENSHFGSLDLWIFGSLRSLDLWNIFEIFGSLYKCHGKVISSQESFLMPILSLGLPEKERERCGSHLVIGHGHRDINLYTCNLLGDIGGGIRGQKSLLLFYERNILAPTLLRECLSSAKHQRRLESTALKLFGFYIDQCHQKPW